jgi:hypothetical protein
LMAVSPALSGGRWLLSPENLKGAAGRVKPAHPGRSREQPPKNRDKRVEIHAKKAQSRSFNYVTLLLHKPPRGARSRAINRRFRYVNAIKGLTRGGAAR